jgi:histidine triad (HIT) family protein
LADCIFCDILSGKADGTFVYRDEKVAVFMDIQPINSGHVLVVPNVHAATLADLDPEVGGHLFRVAQEMAHVLRGSEVRCDGVSLFLADGAAAMQDVPHVHLHVFPRHWGDGFGFTFAADYFSRPDRSELERIAEVIRRTVNKPSKPSGG